MEYLKQKLAEEQTKLGHLIAMRDGVDKRVEQTRTEIVKLELALNVAGTRPPLVESMQGLIDALPGAKPKKPPFKK